MKPGEDLAARERGRAEREGPAGGWEGTSPGPGAQCPMNEQIVKRRVQNTYCVVG